MVRFHIRTFMTVILFLLPIQLHILSIIILLFIIKIVLIYVAKKVINILSDTNDTPFMDLFSLLDYSKSI